jgi:hypothetical protein
MFTPASFMDAAPGYRYQPDSAGKFEIKDVPPGSYLLMAWGLSRNGPSLHSPMMRVDVGATDIEGLVVPVVLGPTVSGRIQIDGSGSALPFDATGVVVKFRGRVGQGVGFFAGDSFTGNVNPDGSYSTARGAGAFPGEFDVTVQNLPPGFYLKSPLTLQIPANEVPPSISLDLILARHQGVTSGTVTRGPGRPAAGAKVVLVPVEALQRRADRFPRASTDSEGKFRIVSAPPGDYTAYAFEDIEAEAQYSSEFLQTYVGRGSRVSIVANSDVSLNLQLIPKEAR